MDSALRVLSDDEFVAGLQTATTKARSADDELYSPNTLRLVSLGG